MRKERDMTSHGNSTGIAEIDQTIEGWARALRAKDAAVVISYGTEDYVLFSLAPPLQVETREPKGLEAWFATWVGPIGYERHQVTIAAGPDLAFAHSLNRMTGIKTDGAKPDLWFRQTLCLRKVDGRWKIAHQHDSVPFHMDGSFRAAVDLRP
jgi:PhnB protein